MDACVYVRILREFFLNEGNEYGELQLLCGPWSWHCWQLGKLKVILFSLSSFGLSFWGFFSCSFRMTMTELEKSYRRTQTERSIIIFFVSHKKEFVRLMQIYSSLFPAACIYFYLTDIFIGLATVIPFFFRKKSFIFPVSELISF